MRHVLAALLLIAGVEAAALACSCIPPPANAAEARAAAREVARRAVAMVEAEVVSGYDRAHGRGEWVRVRRVLGGRAPGAFRVHRMGPPSSAACGLELRQGQRAFLILYPARTRAPGEAQFAVHGLCTDHFARDPALRRLVIAQLRRR